MNMSAPINTRTKTPDINIPGEIVDQLIAHLNNSIIYARAQDGSMRPFIDPIPINQIIAAALQMATVGKDGDN